MFKMTVVQLVVLLFVICLSTQVVSLNTTIAAGTKATTSSNATTASGLGTIGNSTKPTGVGVSLHAGAISVLTPVIMAASLLQRYS